MADRDARRGGSRPSSGARGQQGKDKGGRRGGRRDDASPSVTMAQQGGSWEEDRAFWSQGVPPKAATRPGSRRIPTAVIACLIMLSLVVGFCATQGVMRAIDLLAAALDAQSQVTSLESIAKSGQYFSGESMSTLQTRLHALDDDVLRVQADLPVGEFGAKGTEITHAFRMATDLILAGEYGVDAGQTMIPAVKSIMGGLGSSTTASKAPTLTLADLERVNNDVTYAGALAQAALVERAQIQDSDLDSLHLGKVASVLDKLDTFAPKIPKYIALAKVGLAALQPLLGISPSPTAHYLLFDEDSDELRPTGGFLGNFALLTLQSGRLQGGVHLQNIYTYDCPGYGGFPTGCRDVVIPSSPTNYTWMRAGGDLDFGVRDANLEPDFPTSANYIETQYNLDWQNFSQLQKRYPQKIDGVFAFTPQFIGKILDALGGITVPGFNVHVTSANLQDYIHYYHVLYAYCLNPNYGPNDPKTCSVITGSKTNKTDQKAFDAAIGTAVMHAAAAASPSIQGKIIKAALDSLQTRDLQLYFNNPQIQSLLTQLHLDATMPAVHGDQTMLEDVNIGATYANADLQEHISDTITLNADGSASHDMVVTYSYPWEKHLYNQPDYRGDLSVYTATGESYDYAAVARVIVPNTASLDYPNCDGQGQPSGANQYPNGARSIIPCTVNVDCNQCSGDGTNNGQTPDVLTQEYTWTVPAAVAKTKGLATYDYTFVHEAGAHPTLTVTIYGPNGKKLSAVAPPVESTPLLGAAPPPVLTAVPQGGLQYGGKNGTLLTRDVTIAVAYKP